MRATRRVRSAVALLSMLALVGKVLAGAFCVVPAAPAAGLVDPVLVDPVLGPLSICASGGHDTPPPGGDPDPMPNGAADHWTACTLLGGITLGVTPAYAAVVFPATAFPSHRAAGVRTLPDHLSLGGIRSRAPPLPA